MQRYSLAGMSASALADGMTRQLSGLGTDLQMVAPVSSSADCGPVVSPNFSIACGSSCRLDRGQLHRREQTGSDRHLLEIRLDLLSCPIGIHAEPNGRDRQASDAAGKHDRTGRMHIRPRHRWSDRYGAILGQAIQPPGSQSDEIGVGRRRRRACCSRISRPAASAPRQIASLRADHDGSRRPPTASSDWRSFSGVCAVIAPSAEIHSGQSGLQSGLLPRTTHEAHVRAPSAARRHRRARFCLGGRRGPPASYRLPGSVDFPAIRRHRICACRRCRR